jgi:hypothetical protein
MTCVVSGPVLVGIALHSVVNKEDSPSAAADRGPSLQSERRDKACSFRQVQMVLIL